MAEEFPSNVLPWRRVAENTGATLTTVATPSDGDWTAAILDAIRPGIRVVALSHCHWTNGALLDLAPIGAACRRIGAIFVLDLTQSLGALPFDLAAVDPDFMVAAGYKWLLCPYGFGLMYVAPRWRDARPLEETWLARAHAEDFATLVNYSDVYRPGARRFDVGETCVRYHSARRDCRARTTQSLGRWANSRKPQSDLRPNRAGTGSAGLCRATGVTACAPYVRRQTTVRAKRRCRRTLARAERLRQPPRLIDPLFAAPSRDRSRSGSTRRRVEADQ